MKFLNSLTVLALVLGSVSMATATVTLQVNGGLGLPQLVSSDSTPLPDGSSVEFGYFNTGFDLAANQDDLTALRGAWNLFGSTTTTTLGGEAGRLAGAVSNTNTAFDHQQVYLWGFLGDVEEYGIFTSDAPEWVFPLEGSIMPSTLLSTADINQVVHGKILPGELKLAIRLPAGAGAVPEPSFLLGWLALLSGLLRRRTRG